jgi:hypothetical protein
VSGRTLSPGAKPKPVEQPAPHATPDDDAPGFVGPSPDPGTNQLLANLALTGGLELVRRGLEQGLLGKGYAPGKARQLLKARPLTQTLAGAALTRLATRSVPGAILVGTGLLAKTLYDRRRARAQGAEPSGQDTDAQDA